MIGEKMIFFLLGLKTDYKIIRDLCDVLWEKYKIKTTLDFAENLFKKFPGDCFVPEYDVFKSAVIKAYEIPKGQNRLFMVNYSDYHHQGILREFVDFPICQLTFQNENCDQYQVIKEIIDSFIE